MIGIALHSRSSRVDLEAVAVGQAEVEQDDVGVARGGLGQALARRSRPRPGGSRWRERRAQEAPHLRLVLDQQDEGGGRRCPSARHPSSACSERRRRCR